MILTLDDLKNILIAVGIVIAIAALMGLLLAVADKFLYVEVDERIDVVTSMLPNANCGGCGFPGCSGFATALVEGKAKKSRQTVFHNAVPHWVHRTACYL